MEAEKVISETAKPLYLYNYHLVNDMFTYFVEHLISITKFLKRSSDDICEIQVQKWVEKLLKFREHCDKYFHIVSLEWIMMKATTELQKEIDEYLSKNNKISLFE